MRIVTLVYLIKDDEVLLAMKKKRFGAGNWNGVGGGIEVGETEKDSAIREAKEEIGVTLKAEDLEKVAVLTFRFPHKPESDHEVHTYFVRKWEGTPTESEEMGSPTWFKKDALPLDKMWPSDPYWFPAVLEGKHLKAYCIFSPSGEVESFKMEALEI